MFRKRRRRPSPAESPGRALARDSGFAAPFGECVALFFHRSKTAFSGYSEVLLRRRRRPAYSSVLVDTTSRDLVDVPREPAIQLAGVFVAGSVRRVCTTQEERETFVGTKAGRSQRQQISRASQTDCALINDRMFISRRFQNRVVAALQSIANHIHRFAHYPVDTPVASTG